MAKCMTLANCVCGGMAVALLALAGVGCIDLGAPAPVTVPDGWRSVWVVQREFSADTVVPSCSNGEAADVYFQNPAQGGECTPCECSYFGATCTTPGFRCDVGTNPECGIEDQYKFKNNSCQSVGNTPTGTAACQITSDSSVNDPGQCMGTPSVVIGAAWETTVFACSAVTDACSGSECFSQPPVELESAKLCITQTGNLDCPDGWAVETLDAYASGNDERSCGSCACDTNAVQCTGGKITIFDAPSCFPFTFPVELKNPLECTMISAYFDSDGVSFSGELGTAMPGPCIPPTVTGTVVPQEPRTICCR